MGVKLGRSHWGRNIGWGCLRIFGPKRDELTGGMELNDLYWSPNIVWVIKSERMRWAGHVARLGEKRGVYRVLVGKPEGKRLLGKPRRRWEGILKWILRKWARGPWTGLICLRIGTGGGHFWMLQRTFGFHKMREISWLADELLASQEGLCSME